MSSYLITFKPKSENSTRGMDVGWLQRFAARLQDGATLKCEWRFLTIKNVRNGERAFLILQGKRGPALIGFGRLAGLPRKRNGSHCAPIAFERLVDPEDRALADKKSLLAIDASSIWATQFSGRRIPDEIAIELELLIAGRGTKALQSREDLLNAVNALPANVDCLRYSRKKQWQGWLSEKPASTSARLIYNRLENAEMLVWLAAAAGIDPPVIIEAKQKLEKIGRSSQTQAAAIRRLLPWQRVAVELATSRFKNGEGHRALEDGDLARDLEAIYHSGHKKTTIDALVKARLGQGWFRANLERRWDYRCAVTQWAIPSLLRASHIKPWSKSSNDERLNPANGILLAAHIDALFDRGLISFSNEGKMLVSRQIDRDLAILQLPSGLTRKPSEDEKRFLEFHRTRVFCR